MIGQLFKILKSMLQSPARMQNRSWMTEFFTRNVRDILEATSGQPVEVLRKRMNLANYHPAMKKIVQENINVAGVPCLKVKTKINSTINAPAQSVIIYLHGGGYVFGTPKSYISTLAQLAVNSNATVIAVDYRLAPEHAFPAANDDCLSVVKELLDTIDDDVPIILAGDSAGGALSVATALELAQSESQRQLDGLVLLSPWVEPTASSGSIITNDKNDFLIGAFLGDGYQAYMQGADVYDPRTNFIKSDLSKLPKIYVQAGCGEIFIDQVNDFCQRATEQGVDLRLQVYPAQCHVFQVFSPILKDARHAMRDIASFINTVKPSLAIYV